MLRLSRRGFRPMHVRFVPGLWTPGRDKGGDGGANRAPARDKPQGAAAPVRSAVFESESKCGCALHAHFAHADCKLDVPQFHWLSLSFCYEPPPVTSGFGAAARRKERFLYPNYFDLIAVHGDPLGMLEPRQQHRPMAATDLGAPPSGQSFDAKAQCLSDDPAPC